MCWSAYAAFDESCHGRDVMLLTESELDNLLSVDTFMNFEEYFR